jgi:hypothetical protein
VEDTLHRTAPGQAFSGTVLAALPAIPAAVGVGAAGKGAAVAKAGFLGIGLGPLIGIFGGILAHWLVVRSAPTAQERRVKTIGFISLWVFVLAWCLPGQFVVRALGEHFQWNEPTFYAVMAGFWWLYAAIVAALSVVVIRRALIIRRQNEGANELPAQDLAAMNPGRRAAVVIGMYLALFSWLIYLAWRMNDPVWATIGAVTMVLLGGMHFFRTSGRPSPAIMRSVAQQLILAWAVILLILNCRLETWIVSLHGGSPFPMPGWVIPGLTLALVLWFGILVAVTRPKRSA